MTNTAPAQYTVAPATAAGWWRVLDPAGAELFLVRDPAAAITAATQLTAGVPVDTVRDSLDRAAEAAATAPVPAPAPPAAADPDGYTSESLVGLVGDPAAAEALAAQATPGPAVTTQPIVTAAAADSTEPIVVPFPELGRSYRFVNPEDVPALESLVISELAMAAQHESLQAQLAAMVQVLPRFLRKFMLPEDFLAFEPHANATLRGREGMRILSNWTVGVASNYTGFPTQPAES